MPGDQRGDGRPAEPPEGTRRQLVDGVVAGRRLHLREGGHLHEVEVVEEPDPGDAHDHVEPPRGERPSGAADDDDHVGQRHAVPLSPAACGAQHNTGGGTGHGPLADDRRSSPLTNGANRAYRAFPMIALQRTARARRYGPGRGGHGASRWWRSDVDPGSRSRSGTSVPWLRDGDPATVVVALLRWVALVGADVVAGLDAALRRGRRRAVCPAAVRAVRWSTLPAVRRAVDAACAVSVATSVVLAPAVAGRCGAPRAIRPA